MREAGRLVADAILTSDYVVSIGMDFYAKDAKEAVDIARQVLG